MINQTGLNIPTQMSTITSARPTADRARTAALPVAPEVPTAHDDALGLFDLDTEGVRGGDPAGVAHGGHREGDGIGLRAVVGVRVDRVPPWWRPRRGCR